MAVALPLSALGPCVQIAHTSVIQGFFDVVNPLLIESARRELGLPAGAARATDSNATQ